MRVTPRAWGERVRRRLSRIWIRILAFNLLLVFVPLFGMLLLDVYERQLLAAQERAMVQQGRVLAAALAAGGTLDEAEARGILERLEGRVTARLRVLDAGGHLLADSAQLAPGAAGAPEPNGPPATRESLLYRSGSFLYRLLDRPPEGPSGFPEYYDAGQPFDGPEVRAALEGRYGAATRLSPGQRSVTLYSAIPVRGGEAGVVGAVLVSQSTLRLLQDLYELRLATFRVFLASLAVAAVLSLLVATTIVRPVDRLRGEAARLLDRRGRLRGRFSGSERRDEIGDLTRALDELTRRLAEHLRFIESFAADVSHEFKNPLAAIRNAVEVLADTGDEPTRRRMVELASREVARMERLLSAVQEVTAIDARVEDEPRAPVALDVLLAQLLEGWRLRRPGRRVELEVGEPVTVSGTPDRLVQVFDNLLDNALGLSPAEAPVDVWVGSRGLQAVVTVRDHGPGVPAEHRERVFDRFFSWRPERRGGDHAGLGLSIVRAIVEGYGGSVLVREAVGGGAVFEVTLPRVAPPSEVPAA